MGTLIAQVDLLAECNPGQKAPEEAFVSQICSNCANAKCVRSRYTDKATQEKIVRQEKLLDFVDPAEVEESPLSQYPESVGLPEQDPWAAPTVESLHKKWDDKKKDPWSADYAGSVNVTVGANATIRLPGKKK